MHQRDQHDDMTVVCTGQPDPFARLGQRQSPERVPAWI